MPLIEINKPPTSKKVVFQPLTNPHPLEAVAANRVAITERGLQFGAIVRPEARVDLRGIVMGYDENYWVWVQWGTLGQRFRYRPQTLVRVQE